KPLSYCRVCDAVCDDFDAFYAHIQTQEHIDQKESDSLPVFDPIGEEEEPLTRNQVIGREFVNIALVEKSGEEILKGEKLISRTPKDLVEYRLKRHPCVECSSIWEEYGSLLEKTPNMNAEFMFRSHPLHPCVALLNIVLEVFKAHLVIDNDLGVKVCTSRSAKFPSKETLKEFSDELTLLIT
ncbi:hypothetical protein PFISCL1PPCAC_4683, partial [Pristionchus fissidentatus]